jgi:hypothetical protein
VTGPVDRDRQVENLLRQSMPSGAPALSLCIDAERLAAWSAGALRREDAAAVERHLADCAHCQAMLAAFVDSEPPATGAVSVWQRWSIRWLVPAAAASAAVLVWVLATREPAEPPAASTTMARVEEAPSMPPTSPVVPERQQAMPPASPAAQRSADEAAAAARPFAPAGEPPEGAGGRARSEMTADARSNVPAGSVAQSANAARSAERSSASPSPPSSPATGVGPAASAPFAQRESVEFDAAAKAGPATLGAQALVPALARAGSAAVVFAADSTLAPMWRIQPDGRVEGSSDRGQTWSQVALGPAPRVAAGSAPTADVCWLVGAEGVVWRSTDGATFVRRPFVEATALVTVVAQDATRATVTTADGRAFTTTDGGGSWRLGP